MTANDALDKKVFELDRANELRATYGITFTRFADIGRTSFKKHLVHNFLGTGEMSCLFGAPGCGKSVLASDLAAHIASGQIWFERKTLAGGVVFIAAERAMLVKRRLAAFRYMYEVADDVPLAVVSGEIDLRSRTAADGIIACAKRLEDESGAQTVMIVGDTMSRLLGAGDENAPRDVGTFINNIGYVQNKTSAHVMLVHHVPHDAHRMRGHGLALAAMDTTIHVEKTGMLRTATIEKNNDGEEGASIAFKLESVDLGTDPITGVPTTAPIVMPTAPSDHRAADTEPKLTPNQKTVFAILHAAGRNGLTTEQWNDKARTAGIGVRRRADIFDARESLRAKNLVRVYGDRWNAVL